MAGRSPVLLHVLSFLGLQVVALWAGAPRAFLHLCDGGPSTHQAYLQGARSRICARRGGSPWGAHAAQPALRMASAGGAGGGDDLDARVEKALQSRLAPGSAGKQNMPMSREERRRYERLGEDLMDAVRENDAARVKQLCAQKEADPAYADEYGFSCLHLAAKRGYTAVVQALVDLGSEGFRVQGVEFRA